MKYIIKYLIISSIVLHIIIILSAIWIVPIINNALSSGKNWPNDLNNSEIGIINDICMIERDGLRYKGYKITYKNQDLYVMGVGSDNFVRGEEVKVIVTPHPYGPLKSLMITITKK